MPDPIPSTLRRDILFKRDNLALDFINSASERIVEVLGLITAFKQARLPFIYVSFRTEVITHRLIRERLAKSLPVAVPFTDIKNRRIIPVLIKDWEHDLTSGSYGILEPCPSRVEEYSIPPGLLDVIIVPGSVFDRHCGRYGYGGGYYDRFLERNAPLALRIGLAFQLQLLESVPLAPYDQRMDLIVTETEIIECERR